MSFSEGKRWCEGASVSFLHPFPPAPQRPRARHVGWRGEAEFTLRRRCKWTGAGSHLHGRRAATNPDRRSNSPRAFWGRTDSPGALWKAGPAAGGGGTVPGAARGIRAGSRALPVSGGGVQRADCLLGGLGAERRAGEAERDRAEEQPRRQVPAPWPQGWGGRLRRPGNRILSFAGRGPPRRFGVPSRTVSQPPKLRFGASCAGEASRRARRMPLAQLRGPSAPRRPAGPVLPPGGAESGGRESRSPPPPRSPSRRRGRSRPLVLTRLLFPARGDRSRFRLPSAAPDSPEARRL